MVKHIHMVAYIHISLPARTHTFVRGPRGGPGCMPVSELTRCVVPQSVVDLNRDNAVDFEEMKHMMLYICASCFDAGSPEGRTLPLTC